MGDCFVPSHIPGVALDAPQEVAQVEGPEINNSYVKYLTWFDV